MKVVDVTGNIPIDDHIAPNEEIELGEAYKIENEENADSPSADTHLDSISLTPHGLLSLLAQEIQERLKNKKLSQMWAELININNKDIPLESNKVFVDNKELLRKTSSRLLQIF